MLDPKLLADHERAKQVALLLDNKCDNLEKRLEDLVGQLAALNGHIPPPLPVLAKPGRAGNSSNCAPLDVANRQLW